MAAITPELYVVGAGPGDQELLSLQAHKVLQTAAVILYDNLANRELLAGPGGLRVPLRGQKTLQ